MRTKFKTKGIKVVLSKYQKNTKGIRQVKNQSKSEKAQSILKPR